jgi:tripartite-type tricarboxylate transporter receptor subunit TctC
MTMKRHGLRAAMAALCVFFVAGGARAQAPVTIVTAFGAGSAADIVARLLAAEFAPSLGVPVVVNNITGAAGTIAANHVVRARSDGNTLLFTPIGPIAIQPNFMRNAGYTAADLTPICMVNRAPLIMMTPQNSGLRTLADVVARARQGNFPYGTTGVGTTPHLSMVMFARAAGVAMEHITYRGPAEVMIAFARADVLVMTDHPSSIRANNLHPIATLAAERFPDFPDTPTFREQGFDLAMHIWHGLFAPRGTPEATLQRVEAACAQAVRSEAMRVGHERIQTPIVHVGAQDFARIVAEDSARMRRIVDENNLRQAE